MIQAFYTGVSGIKSDQTAIDVTSDNIANINTVGYRQYNTEFSSIYNNMINTDNPNSSVSNSIGMGTDIQATGMSLAKGSLLLTDRSTDLAIGGDGWFGVQSDSNTLYTRAGNFGFDINNDFVTTDGFHVLGTMGNNIKDGVLTSIVDEVKLGNVATQEELNFPKNLTYPPEPTKNAQFKLNLGIEDKVRTVGASVVDSQGNINNLELRFTQTQTEPISNLQWDVEATVKSLDATALYDTQSATISFDSTGAIVSTTLNSIDNNGTEVSIDLGTGFDGISSVNTPLSTGSSQTDGLIGGDLAGYEINNNAEVIATFTNGMQSSVGKIALYHFQNDQGLDRIGGSSFKASSNSGEPIFFQDENGQNILGSDVKNYQLENSNVKMEVALSELIILQRSFDSNSKVISTADQMLQKAIDMDA